MKIRFVNHACFIIESNKTKIICDPWFDGNIFDDGWSLIHQGLSISDFDFDYVWISHEHPDHFRPNMFCEGKIDTDKTIILQQRPNDRKLYNWFKKKNYNVLEIPSEGELNINDIKLKGDLNYDFDSWVMVECNGKTILNLNDCIAFKERYDIEDIKNKVGNVDVLMNQFSFANWSGNKGDNYTPQKARELIINNLDIIRDIINPKYVIPFASFCYFSHEENFHLNKNSITLRDGVYKPLLQHMPLSSSFKTPNNESVIIMKPKDVWNIGDEWLNNEVSIKFWENEINSLSDRELTKTISHSFEDLKNTFDKMKQFLRNKNDLDLLDIQLNIEPSIIYLTDLDICVSYCILSDINVVEYDIDNVDVKMSSESLNNVMKNAWGFGTLMVNGRFEANYKKFDNFVNQTRLYYMNNIGKFFPKDVDIDDIVNSPSLVKKIVNLGENNERKILQT